MYATLPLVPLTTADVMKQYEGKPFATMPLLAFHDLPAAKRQARIQRLIDHEKRIKERSSHG